MAPLDRITCLTKDESMKAPHFLRYLKKTEELQQTHEEESAMAQAVGGNFDAVGTLEYCLLKQEGLQPTHTLIDVGCGSGRLAMQLRDYLVGTYVGIDVVPTLLQFAERTCERSDWKFYVAPGTSIPEPDASADFVTSFSVFTHLLAEETYCYMAESARVLKPGGKLVFSFLEFRIPSHWAVFEATINDTNPDKVLNQFMDRDMIRVFSDRLGLEVDSIQDGDIPHIRLERPICWDDGREMAEAGNLGQSICVLRKRETFCS